MPASACDPATTIHPFHPSIHDVPCRHPSHLSLRQSSSSARQRSMQCGTAAGASRQLTVPCMRIRAFRPAPPRVSSWIRLPSPWVSSCIRLPSPPQARTPHIPIPSEPVNQSSRATAEWTSGDLPPPLVRSFVRSVPTRQKLSQVPAWFGETTHLRTYYPPAGMPLVCLLSSLVLPPKLVIPIERGTWDRTTAHAVHVLLLSCCPVQPHIELYTWLRWMLEATHTPYTTFIHNIAQCCRVLYVSPPPSVPNYLSLLVFVPQV
jgi:hypothetical protein